MKNPGVAGEDESSIPVPYSRGLQGQALADCPAHWTLDNSRTERQKEEAHSMTASGRRLDGGVIKMQDKRW